MFSYINPSVRRKLEDKLLVHKIELRPLTLNLNLEDLRKNREMPAGFLCFLGVADSTLPQRGVAHRSVRGSPEAEMQINQRLVQQLSFIAISLDGNNQSVLIHQPRLLLM